MGDKLDCEDFFSDQDVDYLEIDIPQKFENWFAGINISNNEAFTKLAKISRKQIKVGLQYLNQLSTQLYMELQETLQYQFIR